MAYRLYYFGCLMLETSNYNDVVEQAYRWYRAALSYQTPGEIDASWRGSVYVVRNEVQLSFDTLIQSIFHYQKEDAAYINPRGRTVPGTRKWRGGGGCHRRIATTSESRMNQQVDPDDVLPRCSRRKLPNSWDDFMRHYERNWKSQHKGSKSWDR